MLRRNASILSSRPRMAFQRASRSCHVVSGISGSPPSLGATAWGGGFRLTDTFRWVTSCGGDGRRCPSSGSGQLRPAGAAPSWRHDSTSSVAMPTVFRRISAVNRWPMPGSSKLFRGIRKVRANGSPSGLNQTSATCSPGTSRLPIVSTAAVRKSSPRTSPRCGHGRTGRLPFYRRPGRGERRVASTPGIRLPAATGSNKVTSIHSPGFDAGWDTTRSWARPHPFPAFAERFGPDRPVSGSDLRRSLR
jgi:hypothetical protein